MTVGLAVTRVSQEVGHPAHLLMSNRFPEDTLVVMTESVSEVPSIGTNAYLREVRLTTFVGDAPVSGIIVKTEWLPERNPR